MNIQRSSKNEKLENFLTELKRLTLVHERVEDSYRFSDSGEPSSVKDGKNEKKVEKKEDRRDEPKPARSGSSSGNATNTKSTRPDDEHSGSEKTAAASDDAAE